MNESERPSILQPPESTDSASIEVLPMPVAARSEIRGMDEDWTGMTSSAMRRKLQNRLNQRASSKSIVHVPSTIAENGV